MSIINDGKRLVIILAVTSAALIVNSQSHYAAGSLWGVISLVLGILALALGAFIAFFFRDPKREISRNDNHIISPADGTVLEVSEHGGAKTIRIFLSVFNVHLQRAPVSGTIKNVEYKPGKFLPAMKPEAHVENEQNIITMETPKGNYVVKQIAGILARRVISWVKAGDSVALGQKIGFIKFGSQVDLTLPASADVKVKTGDKVRGGLTVLAEY